MNIVELGCRCGTLWFFNLPSAKKTHFQPQIWSIWPIFPKDSESLPKFCYIKRKNSEILSKLRNSEPVEVSAWQFMVSLRLPNKGGSGREESTWDSVSPTTAVHVGRSLRMFCLMRYIMQYVLQMYENTNEIFAEGGFSFLHMVKSKSNLRLTDLCPTLKLVIWSWQLYPRQESKFWLLIQIFSSKETFCLLPHLGTFSWRGIWSYRKTHDWVAVIF